MAFDLSNRLLLTLGHTVRDTDGTGNITVTLPPFNADSRSHIEDLISQIEALDTQYNSALADSMAERVDNMIVDYPTHLALLASRGTILLQRLSAFSNVPLKFNSFTGQSYGSTASKNALSIRNYY